MWIYEVREVTESKFTYLCTLAAIKHFPLNSLYKILKNNLSLTQQAFSYFEAVLQLFIQKNRSVLC